MQNTFRSFGDRCGVTRGGGGGGALLSCDAGVVTGLRVSEFGGQSLWSERHRERKPFPKYSRK